MSLSRTRRRLLIAAGASLIPLLPSALRASVGTPAANSSGAAGSATGSIAHSGASASADAPRSLAFLHTHTGEHLAVTFAHGETYVPAALDRLNWLMRDFRNGALHPIDPALFDQLHALAAVTRSQAPFQIVSGYRSPATNAMLHKASSGVASQSLHLTGQAMDLRLADVPLGDLRDAALSLKAGGVGFYPASDFVHVDTGRVRRW